MAPGTVKNVVLRNITGWASKRVIRDYDEYGSGKPARKALLSYLVLPLLPPLRLRDRVKFSNRGIAQEIPRVLNELGYSVDIVNYDNRDWLPDRPYDLFIGHGGINFESISRRLPDSILRIYFATGIYWREWNARISRRAADLALRKGATLSSNREIQHDEDYALHHSDVIICLGNSNAVETYAKFQNAIGINNAIFPLDLDGLQGKNFSEGRKHFLFFSGRGNVHKGLDILLEAFADTDLHLHVCQHLEPDFAHIYRRELTRCPNIHVHGFIRMRSKQFESLAQQCNWVISPSCTEGQPGAVLECMAYGLIPILSRETNIDIGDRGVRLDCCQVESLRSIAYRMSEMSVETIQGMIAKTVETTRTVYSIEKFRLDLHRAFVSIIKEISGSQTIPN